jgi:hypothetical protein
MKWDRLAKRMAWKIKEIQDRIAISQILISSLKKAEIRSISQRVSAGSGTTLLDSPNFDSYQNLVRTKIRSSPLTGPNEREPHPKYRLNLGSYRSLVCTKVWSMPTSSPHQSLGTSSSLCQSPVHTRVQSTPNARLYQNSVMWLCAKPSINSTLVHTNLHYRK